MEVQSLKENRLVPKWVYWCNECDWEEHTNEHKYDFCPKCGHVNIGRMTNGK